MRLGIKIKVANFSCEVLKDHWVSHFPQCKRTALEEFLNPELFVLEKHLWSRAVIRHCLKNSLLNLFVNNILLVPSVKEGTILNNIGVPTIFNVDLENRVGVSIQASNFDVIMLLQHCPLLDMLSYICKDLGNFMRLVKRKFIFV